MSNPEKFFSRWLYPAVFASWTIFLLFLLFSQRYTLFLRPAFGILLALAACIAMAFMLGATTSDDNQLPDRSDIVRAAVLLVPILFSLGISEKGLGQQALEKRFTGLPSQAAVAGPAPKAAMEPSPAVPLSAPATVEESPLATSGPSQEKSILELLQNPSRYDGQEVRFSGMILHDQLLAERLGGLQTIVYRFLITCCAADALPLVIALQTDDRTNYSENQWVQVSGRFTLQRIGTQMVPVIAEPQIRLIEAPRNQYLM